MNSQTFKVIRRRGAETFPNSFFVVVYYTDETKFQKVSYLFQKVSESFMDDGIIYQNEAA